MARLIFMGSPEIAVDSLKALIEAGHEIPLVVTQPDKPKGRGQHVTAPAVKLAALDLCLEVIQPTKVRVPEFAERLKSLKADGIAVVAYGRLLTKEVIESTPWGCINVHFSLLPKYRGASCVAAALMNGDDETGTTTMLIDEGMDSGPILMQWSEPLYPEDNTASVSLRLAPLGAKQLVQTIAGIEQGNLRPVPQNDAEAISAPLLTKEQGHLDWNQPMAKLFNLYRGLSTWPGIYGFLNGKRLLLSEIRPDESGTDVSPQSPGTLEIDGSKHLYIHGQDGRLEILKVKPEGKKIMQAADFMRGLKSTSSLQLV